MNHSFSKFKKQAYPTLKYANFLTHMLTDKYNDWGTYIQDITTINKYENHTWISLDKMIGFIKIIKDLREVIIATLPKLWNKSQLDENDIFNGENDLKDIEENNVNGINNYIGLINIKYLRKYMLNSNNFNEKCLNNILKGEDLIKDMRLILSCRKRDTWSDLLEYKFMDCECKPFNKYIFILGELICDEIEDRQKAYIIKLKKDKANFIADKYLEAKYSPYTKLGKDRFNKERNKLFA